jgi:choline dehydrogenase
MAGRLFLPETGDSGQRRAVQVLTGYMTEDSIHFGLLFVSPKSRGIMDIQSKDTLKMMKIDHHFLEDPEDLQEIKETFCSYVLKTSGALHKIDPDYGLLLPDEESIFDDNRLEAHIRSTVSSFHDQCSLIMGGEKDGRVVNGIGEVYGVKNLMVADASIIPYHMDGNTSGPVLFNRLRSGREMNEILTKHILWRIKIYLNQPCTLDFISFTGLIL